MDELQKKVEEAMNAPEPDNSEVLQHSPGPWRDTEYDPAAEYVIVDANGEGVISDENHGYMEAFVYGNKKANKALVLAAPDLLAALEKASLGLMAATSAANREGNDTAVEVYRKIGDIARAAIAKARGR
jgi:predicted NBD/HSP70 family sugar kinase